MNALRRFLRRPDPDLFSTLHFLSHRLPAAVPYKPYVRRVSRSTGYEQFYKRLSDRRVEAAIWRGHTLQDLPKDLRLKAHNIPRRYR